jgi:hypothetical protein
MKPDATNQMTRWPDLPISFSAISPLRARDFDHESQPRGAPVEMTAGDGIGGLLAAQLMAVKEFGFFGFCRPLLPAGLQGWGKNLASTPEGLNG